jgi:hypothetical protein
VVAATLTGLGGVCRGHHALRVHQGRGRLEAAAVGSAALVALQIVDLLSGAVGFPLGVAVVDAVKTGLIKAQRASDTSLQYGRRTLTHRATINNATRQEIIPEQQLSRSEALYIPLRTS